MSICQAKSLDDCFTQFRLFQWLQQRRSNAEVCAMCAGSWSISRSQHHDDRTSQLGELFQFFNKHEAVHLGHVAIGQDQMKRFIFLCCLVQFVQCCRTSIGQCWYHVPAAKHFFQDSPICWIVVDDQNPQSIQYHGLSGVGDFRRCDRHRQFDREVKCASCILDAVQGEIATHQLDELFGNR